MSSVQASSPNASVAREGPAVARTLEADSDVARLVKEFPQGASDQAFAQELKKKYHCKKLRTACTQLGLHPQADPSMNHKGGYIKLLSQYRRARQRGEVFEGFPKTKTKQRTGPFRIEVGGRTKHCGFKLVNVLFSPAFISRIVESGALPSTGLEVDAVDGRAKYWRDVATVYDSVNPEFDRIAGPPGRYEGIDPGLAPHHSSAKLCAIWRDMTARYEESFARWKQLGTQDADFAHFCGDLDVLYLYDRLQMQPIRVDLEQFRAPKRARTGDVQQGSEKSASVGEDTDEEKERPERGNFLIPRQVEMPTQHRISSTDDLQEPMYRRILPIPSAAGPAPTQSRTLSASSEVQAPTPSQNSRTLEERMQQILDKNAERRRVDTYDGVIYSSQAVRDTMSAIEALKRGRFDRAVIAQAEESMDAIVQVWLRELDKAGQPRAQW